MKKFMSLFLVLATVQVFAAEFHLRSGEQAIIQPNVATLVTCDSGGTNPNCSQAVQSFKSIIASCMQTYTGGYCAEKYWPQYKKNNPQCIYEGMPVCLQACQQTYTGGYCAEKCQ